MSAKPIKDHLGNEYPSFKEMCKAYNKHSNTVDGRLHRGWTLEQSLTIDTQIQNPCKVRPEGEYVLDHLGNRYISFSEMCRHYDRRINTVKNRLNRGWTLEQALIIEPEDCKTKVIPEDKIIYDHEGNEFVSIAEMCEFWNIDRAVYYGRKKLDWELKDILTKPLDYNGGAPHVFDHLGNEYENEGMMCEAYQIKRSTYRERRKRGWSIERALTDSINEVVPKEDRIGETCIANNGLNMKIIACEDVRIVGKSNKKRNSYCVEFEDGMQVHGVIYKKFKIGRVGHPTLSVQKRGTFAGFNTKRALTNGEDVFYPCTCKKCGLKELYSPQEMMEHEKKCQQNL